MTLVRWMADGGKPEVARPVRDWLAHSQIELMNRLTNHMSFQELFSHPLQYPLVQHQCLSPNG